MKLSFKQKKRIIYAVTVALIVVLVTGVILSLAAVRSGAVDDEYLMLANSAQTLVFTPQDVQDHRPTQGLDIGVLGNVWSGELEMYNNQVNAIWWYYPDFTIDTDDF